VGNDERTASGDAADLTETIYELSDKAFGLARGVAGGEPLSPDGTRETLALREQLQCLGPAVRQAPDPTLRSALSEAIVDVTYALSGGTAPLSLRMAQLIRDEQSG
jgi:hypothetical protein